MERIDEMKEEGKSCFTVLEDTDKALNDLKEKEAISIAMSSYYLLYR